MLSTRISKTKTALASLVAALALGQAGANATVLTFDGSFWTEDRVVPDSYGSNVIGNTSSFIYGPECDITPDVVVDYVGTMRWKSTGYGDLQNFIYADHPSNATQRFLTVVLANTAPGDTVGLHSFDVAAELGETLRIDWIRVYRDGQLAYNNIEPLIPGDAANPSRLSIMFNPPIVGTVVQIELNLTRLLLKSERIGIDNIKFSQTSIPTPGAALLFAAGLGVFAARRRR
ncbi:MAG: hypothetical protein KF768_04600 [Phycisphaeraceae bacterium]|nr:hypothetical protein [Phycisphaeraceae bacterium]